MRIITILRYFLPYTILLYIGALPSYAQTIENGDGSPLLTQYCIEDINHQIVGQPSGGIFGGCGVFQQSGQWYFNTVTATQGVTVFPVQCSLTYTVGGTAVTVPILIRKPVVISPALTDFSTCNGEINLHATVLYAGAYTYSWSPAVSLSHPDSANTEGHITTSQAFVLTAKDITSGCTGSDTVIVTKSPIPVIEVSSDTTINPRTQVQLHAQGANSYQWQPDHWLDNNITADPLAMPQSPITYQVIGVNEFGCKDSATVTINIRENIMIPNAFSPNGDGLNDLFRLENVGYEKVHTFMIFNRWGQKVFQTQDITKGWDGAQNGIPVETGTYYYDIRLDMQDGTVKVFRGAVALIR